MGNNSLRGDSGEGGPSIYRGEGEAIRHPLGPVEYYNDYHLCACTNEPTGEDLCAR